VSEVKEVWEVLVEVQKRPVEEPVEEPAEEALEEEDAMLSRRLELSELSELRREVLVLEKEERDDLEVDEERDDPESEDAPCDNADDGPAGA
jgi:hypothetical protein